MGRIAYKDKDLPITSKLRILVVSLLKQEKSFGILTTQSIRRIENGGNVNIGKIKKLEEVHKKDILKDPLLELKIMEMKKYKKTSDLYNELVEEGVYTKGLESFYRLMRGHSGTLNELEDIERYLRGNKDD